MSNTQHQENVMYVRTGFRGKIPRPCVPTENVKMVGKVAKANLHKCIFIRDCCLPFYAANCFMRKIIFSL